MKKIRIPFSIGDYQEGCYTVETRGDENHKPYSVRIFTVDLLSRYQTIVGAEKIENREVVSFYAYFFAANPSFFFIEFFNPELFSFFFRVYFISVVHW